MESAQGGQILQFGVFCSSAFERPCEESEQAPIGARICACWAQNSGNMNIDLVWSYESYQMRFTCLASVSNIILV